LHCQPLQRFKTYTFSRIEGLQRSAATFTPDPAVNQALSAEDEFR
jgi:hypothetical protein